MGLGAFLLIRKPKGEVMVTYVRTEGIGRPLMVFAIRNDTGHPVTFTGFLDKNTGALYDMEDGSEVPPQSTTEVSAVCKTVNLPHVVHAYVVPWTFVQRESAAERYSRFPEPFRTWFMRKYYWYQPAYRHEVILPES
jgi:hypothetical protein